MPKITFATLASTTAICVAVFSISQVIAYKHSLQRSQKALEVMIRRDAGLPVLSQLDHAGAMIAIRNSVYRKFDNGPENINIEHSHPSLVYAVLGSDQNDMMCGGAAIAYSWALNTVGIPARIVQLAGNKFLAGNDQHQTHVTVEVLIDNRWRISDPTYNASFKCSDGNDFLSVKGVMACLNHGGALRPVVGKAQVVGRSLSDLSLFDQYFAAYARSKVNSRNESDDQYPNVGWVQQSLMRYK
jgi:hypothetical protein